MVSVQRYPRLPRFIFMFLNAVILILQEMLEAALLISVLLVLTSVFHDAWDKTFTLRRRWISYALLLGCVGAWVYARLTPEISEWFDYMGQEVVNSSIHLLSLLFLIVLTCIVPSRYLANQASNRSRLTVISMVIIVLLALVREGSEIILYITGVTSQSENVTPVLLGSIIGGGIGISCGIFLYYSLISLSQQWALRACLILLAFIGGNMASQTVLLLTQADWLPYTAVAWDTSSLLPENSIPGHLLYALVGYEATPSILRIVCYLLGMIVVMAGPLFRLAWPKLEPMNKGAVTRNG